MKTIADIQAIRESMQPAMFIRDNSDEHLDRVFAITNLPSKFTFPENPRSFTER